MVTHKVPLPEAASSRSCAVNYWLIIILLREEIQPPPSTAVYTRFLSRFPPARTIARERKHSQYEKKSLNIAGARTHELPARRLRGYQLDLHNDKTCDIYTYDVRRLGVLGMVSALLPVEAERGLGCCSCLCCCRCCCCWRGVGPAVDALRLPPAT